MHANRSLTGVGRDSEEVLLASSPYAIVAVALVRSRARVRGSDTNRVVHAAGNFARISGRANVRGLFAASS